MGDASMSSPSAARGVPSISVPRCLGRSAGRGSPAFGSARRTDWSGRSRPTWSRWRRDPEPVVTLAGPSGYPPDASSRGSAESMPGVRVGRCPRDRADDRADRRCALITAGGSIAGRLAVATTGVALRSRWTAEPSASAYDQRVADAVGTRPEPAPLVVPGGRKQFVCLCEDVTAKELAQGGQGGLRIARDAQALQHRHDGALPGQDVSRERGRGPRATCAGASRESTGLTTADRRSSRSPWPCWPVRT